jgi:tetratricopeptide (TPR) repeat protein
VSALGYRESAADVAWLQAVQYYGEHRQGGNDLTDFEHYVAAVNVLDPRFQHAYIFGAFVLATEKQDLPAALELLRRGARANPESPIYPFEMGFLTYVEGGDQEAALRYLALSAQLPGGRDRATRFMAHLNRRLGRLETAWMLWNEIYRSSRDPSLRTIAAESMRRLQAEIGRQP